MRILFVNQTAAVSGAERSLLALIDALEGSVDRVLACPRGELAEAAAGLGVRVEPLAGTAVSFRPHPVHTTRGLLDIARSAYQLRSLERRLRPAVVHANTTRAALLALAPGPRPPILAHIRDWIPDGRLPRLVHEVVGRRADLVVANSAYVARQFEGIPLRRPVRVVHNPVDLGPFDPGRADGPGCRRRLGIDAAVPVLTMVAQITPWKAQDDAIRALAALGERGAGAQLLIVGSAKFAGAAVQFDNPAFERSLHELAAQLGVGERVHFLGERDDVPELLAASDLLLLPSWREAFGRIAVEAMAMAVPVVATSEGGPAEIVTDGVDGVLAPPRDPQRWAEAIAPLLADPAERTRLGAAARRRAADFSPAAHAAALLDSYRELSPLSGGAARSSAR